MSTLSAFVDNELNLVKVALVKDDVPIFMDADVLDRPGQLDTIFAATVLRKDTSFYWCDIGLARPGLLSLEKGFQPLCEGEKVLVQIKREAFLDKGETSHHFAKPVELTRQIVLAHQGCLYFALTGQFKPRTALPVCVLSQQQQVLERIFTEVQQQCLTSAASLILPGPTVLDRFLKELPVRTPVKIATPELMLKAKTFCHVYRPDLLDYLILERPGLWTKEGLDEIWQTCLDDIVPVSMGNILIESTACVTTIDVNAPLAKSREFNQQVLGLVAHQLMWRRLSGNVIIDFLADSPAQQQIIQKTLTTLLKADRPAWRILGWSPLGWLELQRSKRRIPLNMVMQQYNLRG
jgi:hypothetical protein